MKLAFLIFGALLALSTLNVSAHPGAHAKLKYINEQLKERPDDQALYIHRGATYSNEGQFELALADLHKAETLGQPLAVAYELGVLHYRKREFTTARGYFDEWLKYAPQHTQALQYRARLLRDAGDHDAAVADFKTLFALQKRSDPGNYISVAKMLAEQDDAGIASAIVMLDEGMQRLGLNPQLQRYAIQLELRRQKTDNAIERLDSLKKMLGNSPDWKADMGELLVKAGRNAEARKLLDAAREQLKTLRRTPARAKLADRITALDVSLTKPATANTPE